MQSRTSGSGVSDQGEATQESQTVHEPPSRLSDRRAIGDLPGAQWGSSIAFSALTTTPNRLEPAANALDSAQQVAQAFNQSINQLDQVSQGVQQDLTAQVGQVNQIAQQIASINQQIEENAGAAADPGLSANMSQALGTAFAVCRCERCQQDNGTVNVSVGQASLVSGDTALPLQLVPGAGQMVLEDSQGNDVSQGLQSGSLKAILNMTSSVMPATVASLNQLAQSFATAVNGALEGGVDQTGIPQGNLQAQDLFTFSAANGAAATISVNPLTTSQLALAAPAAAGEMRSPCRWRIFSRPPI